MDHKDIELPSNRTFGLFFAGVFAVLAAYLYYHGGSLWVIVSGVLSAAFLTVTYVAREALTPLNKLWMRFGLLLAKIVSPIVLGVLFFGLITPVALATRIFGRDELRLKRGAAPSHWRDRDPAGPEPASFSNQF